MPEKLIKNRECGRSRGAQAPSFCFDLSTFAFVSVSVFLVHSQRLSLFYHLLSQARGRRGCSGGGGGGASLGPHFAGVGWARMWAQVRTAHCLAHPSTPAFPGACFAQDELGEGPGGLGPGLCQSRDDNERNRGSVPLNTAFGCALSCAGRYSAFKFISEGRQPCPEP